MNHRSISISAALLLSILVLTGSAIGQQRSLKDQLLGTWTLASHEAVRADGGRFPVYGPSPRGIALFDAGGRFIITVMRADRAEYATNSPYQGTAEENKATVQGTITYFGTYSVREADRTIALHIDASSFPNWNGTDQTRGFVITGDRLTLTARALPTGGYAEVVWTRAK